MRRTAELFDLTGKVVIVTGSTKGIGRAMAEGLASAGAAVVVSSRKQEGCDRVAAEIAAATGAEVMARACHVGEWDAVPGFVDAVYERFGRIDALVNNAGINPARISPQDMTLEYWRKVFSVNLEGPLRMAQLVAPIMRDGAGGSIINIGTAGSLMASVAELPYACAKAGLNALTVGLAEAFAPKVRVNAILPGPFRTDASRGWAPVGPEAPFVPLGRLGEPEEVAPLALHLASAASSFTTGAIIRVDGGVTRKV